MCDICRLPQTNVRATFCLWHRHTPIEPVAVSSQYVCAYGYDPQMKCRRLGPDSYASHTCLKASFAQFQDWNRPESASHRIFVAVGSVTCQLDWDRWRGL